MLLLSFSSNILQFCFWYIFWHMCYYQYVILFPNIWEFFIFYFALNYSIHYFFVTKHTLFNLTSYWDLLYDPAYDLYLVSALCSKILYYFWLEGSINVSLQSTTGWKYCSLFSYHYCFLATCSRDYWERYVEIADCNCEFVYFPLKFYQF